MNQIVEQKVKEFEERFQSEKEQAFKDGFEEGRSRGYRQGIETAEKAEKLLANLIEEIGSQRERILSEAEKVLTRLSLEIAEAVIGEAALKASGEALDHNLKRCLAALGGSGEVKIRISPSDYEFARESFCSLPGRPGGEMADDRFTFVFEPDPSISPGGCFVETDAGAVDARLETQLALMKDNIAKLI